MSALSTLLAEQGIHVAMASMKLGSDTDAAAAALAVDESLTQVSTSHYDIFISLRLEESKEEAKALKLALEKLGFSVFLCEVEPGINLTRTIVHALDASSLAIIMGTLSYGKKTASEFATYEELRYILKVSV